MTLVLRLIRLKCYDRKQLYAVGHLLKIFVYIAIRISSTIITGQMTSVSFNESTKTNGN